MVLILIALLFGEIISFFYIIFSFESGSSPPSVCNFLLVPLEFIKFIRINFFSLI
jgi:hypothetical protein